ncbi:hypothetical protein PROFUN_10746 [Planoprotostelium fungivorum]|uniref:Uncharacterized protein n=1 Tax=Planoprotostelium fungivorum TaxID=1890364 RepID=A0A2P6N7Y7_9EUKA|nr:hypothetical protein PROFUN_10746 [Planoprotostelium fungivorum]
MSSVISEIGLLQANLLSNYGLDLKNSSGFVWLPARGNSATGLQLKAEPISCHPLTAHPAGTAEQKDGSSSVHSANLEVNSIMGSTETVDRFIDSGGHLSSKRHQTFWQNLNNTTGVSLYVSALFCKLLSMELYMGSKDVPLVEMMKQLTTGQLPPPIQDNSNKSPDDLTKSNVKNSVWTTLYYLGLFHSVDPEYNSVKLFMDNWRHYMAKDATVREFEAVIKLFNMSYTESPEIVNLLLHCSDIPEHISNDPYETHPQQRESKRNVMDCDVEAVAYSMIYVFVLSSLFRLHQNKTIVERLFHLLRKHPNFKAPKRILVMLHIIKNVMILTSRENIAMAIDHIKPFYLWPSPIGDYARELLQCLSLEAKIPGYTLRKQILADYPQISGGSPKEGEDDVYVVLDSSVPLAMVLFEFIRASQPSYTSDTQLQLDLLAHIMTINVEGTEEIQWENLSAANVKTFLTDAMTVQNQIVFVTQKQSEEFCRDGLGDLLKKVSSTTFSDSSLNLRPRPLRHKHLNFHFHSMTPDNRPPTAQQIEPVTKIVKRNGTDVLAKIFSSFAECPEGKTPKPVAKLMIVGGDSLLHNMAGALSYLKMTNTETTRILDNVDLQLFYVPCGYGHTSSYMSRRDPWFARHVCTTTVAVAKVLPTVLSTNLSTEPSSPLTGRTTSSVRDNEWRYSGSMNRAASSSLFSVKSIIRAPRQGESDNKMTPAELLYTELENYVLQAKEEVPIHVYQCECTTTEGVTYNIVFVRSVEIGFKVYQRITEEELAAGMTKDKMTKYLAPVLAVRYSASNVLGVPYREHKIDYQYYHVILANNIPNFSAPLHSSDPTKPWLEKKYKTKPTPKDLEMPCLVAHTSTFEAEARPGTHFQVLIDDVLCGPFVKIKVSPVGKSDNPVTLPVRGFLPLMTFS